jgi:hypothetical protein
MPAPRRILALLRRQSVGWDKYSGAAIGIGAADRRIFAVGADF